MDQNLKAYEGFLNNIIENPNYVATAEENTAAYNIQSDITYADLSNELQGCQSYEEQLSVLKKYVKEDEFNNERLNFDDAVQGEEKDHLESIIMKNKDTFGIQDDLSVIKDNIVRFASNKEQIELYDLASESHKIKKVPADIEEFIIENKRAKDEIRKLMKESNNKEM